MVAQKNASLYHWELDQPQGLSGKSFLDVRRGPDLPGSSAYLGMMRKKMPGPSVST